MIELTQMYEAVTPTVQIDAPPVEYMYTIRVIDASRFDGYREEYILGYAHTLDSETLIVMIGEPKLRMWYNFRWVLSFSRAPVHYNGILRHPGVNPQYKYTLRLIDASRGDGCRDEAVAAFAHRIDQHTLLLMVDGPKLHEWFNFKWILSFSRDPMEYADLPSALG